jgi:two-component system, chemotaxis family, protein-glutamate methylesterase/glutaminase
MLPNVWGKLPMEKSEFYVVGLGASAGGYQALKEFFCNIPDNPNIAFVVVTHLLRGHKSILDKILSKFTSLKVVRMKGLDIVRPNTVYVLPEDQKVYMRNGALILKPRNENEIVNKTIDEFFHTLAEDQKEKAVAIILSGMGTDGSSGVESIHEFGGLVLVQEPYSTQFKSMPNAIINRDHPDQVLPPKELARNLIEIIEAKKNADAIQNR